MTIGSRLRKGGCCSRWTSGDWLLVHCSPCDLILLGDWELARSAVRDGEKGAGGESWVEGWLGEVLEGREVSGVVQPWVLG